MLLKVLTVFRFNDNIYSVIKPICVKITFEVVYYNIHHTVPYYINNNNYKK